LEFRRVLFRSGHRRRAHVPAPLADAGQHHRDPGGAEEGASREALLPAQEEGQGRPAEGEDGGRHQRHRVTATRWRRLAREEARLTGERGAVAGVDEAGRGPLAGPVVAAAVILDLNVSWKGLDDSKQLSAEEREQVYARVLQWARALAWSAAGPRVIDRLNIRRATHRAMASAVRRLRLPPDLVLVD